jgi:hypothetical protein
MYAYKEYLINGCCPFCERDLTIHITDLDSKVKHRCVDCQSVLTIVPNRAMYAEIFDMSKRRKLADVMLTGKDCCGV